MDVVRDQDFLDSEENLWRVSNLEITVPVRNISNAVS
jgi:hypothetical protein